MTSAAAKTVTVPLVLRVHLSTSTLGTLCGVIAGSKTWDNARALLIQHTGWPELPDTVRDGFEVCFTCAWKDE